MKPLLVATGDLAGAQLLKPIIEVLNGLGKYTTTILAEKVSKEFWGSVGWPFLDPAEQKIDESLVLNTALIVTGTSHESGVEHQVWDFGKRVGTPTVSFLDAWINLKERFVNKNETIVCADHLAVPHSFCSTALTPVLPSGTQYHVVGHSHLEHIVDQLVSLRSERTKDGPVVFFSEPLEEVYSPNVFGFTQFDAFNLLLQGCKSCLVPQLVIRPHPKEDPSRWVDWIAAQSDFGATAVTVSSMLPRDLLASCVAATGMGSAVLLEAYYSGIPVLALQPGRINSPNPWIDELLQDEVVTSVATAPKEIAGFLKCCEGMGVRSMNNELRGSTGRAVAMIDKIVEATAG